jgi:hypothetical protein
MSVLVGTLAVDVVNGQATFTLDEARSQLDQFGNSAQQAGEKASYSMMEARHSVMLLGEGFGVHLPRAVSSFIASIGPVGAALEAAFPFLAIAVGAAILIKHLISLREEAEKLAKAQSEFGVTSNKVLGDLDDKLLQAGIHVDELAGKHLEALKKQLELIDHASLKDLMTQFDVLSKVSEAVFAQLKTHWYNFGSGSEGARHSLEEFKAQYDKLLSEGKEDEANKLLEAKVAREEHILALQKQAAESQMITGKQQGNYAKYEEAIVELRKLGVGITDKEIEGEQVLVDALHTQTEARKKIQELKSIQTTAAVETTDKTLGAEEDKRIKEQAKEQQAAIDQQEKAWQDAYDHAVSALQESEKLKIAATKEGTAARVAAIDAAIKEEESKGLQDTAYYKGLLVERVRAAMAAAEAEKNARNAALAEQLSAQLVYLSGERVAVEAAHHLGLSTEKQYAADIEKIMREEFEAKKKYLETQISTQTDDSKKLILQKQLNQETAKYQQELSKIGVELRKNAASWHDFFSKMEVQTKTLGRDIRVNLQQSIEQVTKGFGDGVAKMIVEGKSLGDAMRNVAMQILESMISMLVQWLEQWIITHLLAKVIGETTNKAGAMSAAGLAGANMTASWAAAPWPIDAAAPAMGAAAFAAAASYGSFAEGGIVDQTGMAKVHENEMVLPEPISRGLQDTFGMAGGTGGGPVSNSHSFTYAPVIHAVDQHGVERMLVKHAATFDKHLTSRVRRLNK